MTVSISVVIPTFNRAHLIRETLDSVFAQSQPPAEIIVIDDGSTDETAAVLDSYGGSIRHQRVENGGPSAARNAGVALVNHPWIAFLDSDDLWLPDYLAGVSQMIEAAPDMLVVFSDFRLIEQDRWLTRRKLEDAPEDFWTGLRSDIATGGRVIRDPLYPKILRFQPIFPSAMTVRRDYFETLGGYDAAFSRVAVEDFEFTLRCVRAAPVGVLSAANVGIRKHDGNFSGHVLRAITGEVQILRHALTHHDLPEAWRSIAIAEIERRTLNAIDAAFGLGDHEAILGLARSLPKGRLGWKRRLKWSIAASPAPARSLAAALALKLSDARSLMRR